MRDLVDRIGNLGHDCDIVGQLLARSKSVRSRPSHLNALLKLGESESSLILRRDEPKLRSSEPICIAIMSRVISGRSPSSRAKLGAVIRGGSPEGQSWLPHAPDVRLDEIQRS